ncbi:hypothetical protein PHMEG_00039680, partial [Phytophthora megakarya]
IDFVEEYIRVHPCFYLEELQEAVKERFDNTLNNSTPTLCRLLKFDLKITRKILTKRAQACTKLPAYCSPIGNLFNTKRSELAINFQ